MVCPQCLPPGAGTQVKWTPERSSGVWGSRQHGPAWVDTRTWGTEGKLTSHWDSGRVHGHAVDPRPREQVLVNCSLLTRACGVAGTITCPICWLARRGRWPGLHRQP